MSNEYEVTVTLRVQASSPEAAIREVEDELGAASAGVPLEMQYRVTPDRVMVWPSPPDSSENMTNERRKRYGAAIKSWELPERRLPVLLGGLIEKVMAVADAEQAELRAEIERLRREDQEWNDAYMRLDASNSTHMARAEGAEAKVARVEALIEEIRRDGWCDPDAIALAFRAAMDGEAAVEPSDSDIAHRAAMHD